MTIAVDLGRKATKQTNKQKQNFKAELLHTSKVALSKGPKWPFLNFYIELCMKHADGNKFDPPE